MIALGLLFALSAGTLAVKASSMDLQSYGMMSASSMDVEHQVSPDCGDGKSMPLPCKDGGPACNAVCAASMFAVLLEPQAAGSPLSTYQHYLRRVEPLLGGSSSPNPPPRTPYIG